MTLRRTTLLVSLALLSTSPVFAYDLSLEDYDQESLAVIKAAETSDDLAILHQAANILMNDSMMQENVEQGMAYLTKAATLGDSQSQIELADYYYNEEEYVQSLNWFHKAEHSNEPYVLYSLGVMYFEGEGTDSDYQKANYYYQAAAQAGYPDAMYQLAFSYYEGKGVEQDDQKAAYWFQKAVDEGDVSAMYQLGVFYLSGSGVKTDCQKAISLFNQAIQDSNHGPSFAKLGDIYHFTDYKAMCGFKTTDYKKSLSYYKKAAMEGDSYGQYMVGYSYRNGHGEASNFVKALAWFNIAKASGDEEAEKAIDEISGQMSDAEIEKAHELQLAIENEL